MRCARCGRPIYGEGYAFQLGNRTFAKCLSCGDWTDAEKREIVQHMVRSLPPPTPGRSCGCSGKR